MKKIWGILNKKFYYIAYLFQEILDYPRRSIANNVARIPLQLFKIIL